MDEISQNSNARIITCSGNEGAKSISENFASNNVEGVASINPYGKISKFSASRNSIFTQHYEKGEYYQRAVYDKNGNFIGINITGTTGVDIPCTELPKLRKDIPIVGKNLKEYLLSNQEISELLSLKTTNKKAFWEKIYEYQKDYRIISNEQHYQLFPNFPPDNLGCAFTTLQNDEFFRITDQCKIIPSQLIATPRIKGTSFSTPIRAAKLALNDMMEGIL